MSEELELLDGQSWEEWINTLKFGVDGLIPAVIQDAETDQVLMVGYMNRESLGKTLCEGRTCFWSRSRQSLWVKGETSGHYQAVRAVFCDCDRDCLLIQVDQTGDACHLGRKSCFFTQFYGASDIAGPEFSLDELYRVVEDRKASQPEGSYTANLINSGQDRVLKKVAEEAGEVMLASKNNDRDEIIREMADLWFHSIVVLAYHDIPPRAIVEELAGRHRTSPVRETSGFRAEDGETPGC